MGKMVVGAAVVCAATMLIMRHRMKSSGRLARVAVILKDLEDKYATPIGKLRQVADAITVEMHAGMASEGGSKLKMLISYVDNLPTGWTGMYEAHLWDNSCKREGQTRKGRQVYLGGYDKEDKAARAYNSAALKYWGATTTTNFPISVYEKELEEMKHMTRQEYIASLRRKSSGFSRGASMYLGVTR